MIPKGRKYNMFSQGFKARLSVVFAVIFKNIGNNVPSNIPRINVPVAIGIKQCHKLWPVITTARNTENIIRIIVWNPNGSGNSLAETAATPTIKDNINALEQLKCRLKSWNPVLAMRNVCGTEIIKTMYQGNSIGRIGNFLLKWAVDYWKPVYAYTDKKTYEWSVCTYFAKW